MNGGPGSRGERGVKGVWRGRGQLGSSADQMCANGGRGRRGEGVEGEGQGWGTQGGGVGRRAFLGKELGGSRSEAP